MLYSVNWQMRGRNKPTESVKELRSIGAAQGLAAEKAKTARWVTIGQACELSDVTPTAYHKDNVGKYFLHQIVK